MTLATEIEKYRRNIRSDSYSMSIGELASLYGRHELKIDPAFQRHFRWKPHQKVSFIESILVQLPLPAIFVLAGDDGVWDLVDGLQRMSTILEFLGELRDENGTPVPPMKLSKTEMLPDLEGVFFESPENDRTAVALTVEQRIDFRRQRMDAKILLPETGEELIYELFIRLNIGGSSLSAQEVRNAVMNRKDSAFWYWIDGLARTPQFLQALSLTDRDIEQRYDVELALRLIALCLLPKERHDKEALPAFLTRLVQGKALYNDVDRDAFETNFAATFNAFLDRLGPNSFARRAEDPLKPIGGFDHGAYDDVAPKAYRLVADGSDLGGIVVEQLGYWANRPVA